MKKIAKIVIWIEMILGFITIVAPIIGYLTLKKINNASKKQEIKLWGILCIIFVGVISGILVLCIKEEELGKKQESEEQKDNQLDDFQLDIKKEEKASKNKKRKSKFGKICSIIVDILIIPIIVLAFACTILTFTAKANNQVPSIFGISVVTVQSDSMEPNFKVNDVLTIKKINASELKVGDDIAFYAPTCSRWTVTINGEKQSLVIFHKIVRIIVVKDELGNNVRHFVCMGTNVNFDYTDDDNFLPVDEGTGDFIKDPTGTYVMQEDGNYRIKLKDLKPGADENDPSFDDTQTPMDIMQYVTDDLVVGIYDSSMSQFIGGFIKFCSSTTGMLCLVIIPSVLLIGLTIISLTKEVKAAKEEDEKEKLVLEGNMSKLKETSSKVKEERQEKVADKVNQEVKQEVNIEEVIDSVDADKKTEAKTTAPKSDVVAQKSVNNQEGKDAQSSNKPKAPMAPKAPPKAPNKKTLQSASEKTEPPKATVAPKAPPKTANLAPKAPPKAPAKTTNAQKVETKPTQKAVPPKKAPPKK